MLIKKNNIKSYSSRNGRSCSSWSGSGGCLFIFCLNVFFYFNALN